MSPPRTIVFHPQNHVGLGHTNRLAAIALAVREMDSAVRTSFVVEGASHTLLDALGLPYLPLPSAHRLHETQDWNQWPRQKKSDLEAKISHAILESLQPHVAVFDCFPNEAFAAAVLERQLPIAICLRETAHLDLQLDRMRHFLPKVCAVLVPHNPGTFEVPPELKGKSRFVGTIARPRAEVAKPTCEKHGLEIVISGGGGGHPDTAGFFNLVLQAIVSMQKHCMNPAARLIAGPLFNDWLALKPVPGVVIVPFDPALVNTMDSADLVVCQGGYNTVAELEQITAKAIIIPGHRRWDDQFARAARLAKENPRIRVFSGSAAPELAHAMITFLEEPVTLTRPIEQQGAHKAAEYLLEFLGNSRPDTGDRA